MQRANQIPRGNVGFSVTHLPAIHHGGQISRDPSYSIGLQSS